jgi:hypothetical protein
MPWGPSFQMENLLHYCAVPGPLAHPEEQGTFNPKVPGSRPGRPTTSQFRALSAAPSVRFVAGFVANGSKSGNSSIHRGLAHRLCGTHPCWCQQVAVDLHRHSDGGVPQRVVDDLANGHLDHS